MVCLTFPPATGMTESLKAGKVITLPTVGLFADGAAVRTVGQETFRVSFFSVPEVIICFVAVWWGSCSCCCKEVFWFDLMCSLRCFCLSSGWMCYDVFQRLPIRYIIQFSLFLIYLIHSSAFPR